MCINPKKSGALVKRNLQPAGHNLPSYVRELWTGRHANNGALPPSSAKDEGRAYHYAHHHYDEPDHDERGDNRLVGGRVKVDAEQGAVRHVTPRYLIERLEVRRTKVVRTNRDAWSTAAAEKADFL
jgi:hypothetical protein